MGFFKKDLTLRADEKSLFKKLRRQDSAKKKKRRPATVVNPPSSHGAQNVPPTVQVTTVEAYGAFPDLSPVQATPCAIAERSASFSSAVAIAAATPCVPESSSAHVIHTAAAVPAIGYNDNQGHNPSQSHPKVLGPRKAHTMRRQQSVNNGNSTYNTDKDSCWECSVCTFPNHRTESDCKGCGSIIPPELQYSASAYF